MMPEFVTKVVDPLPTDLVGREVECLYTWVDGEPQTQMGTIFEVNARWCKVRYADETQQKLSWDRVGVVFTGEAVDG